MKHVRRKWNIGDASDGARFSIVERFEFSEFVRVLENEIADFPNQFAALACRETTPWARFKGAPRCSYRAIDVILVAVRNAGNDRCVGGIEYVEQFSGRGRRPFAADQILFWFFQPGGNARTDPCFGVTGTVSVTSA